MPQQGEGPKGQARARSGSCGLPRPARVTASIGGVPTTSREPRDQGQGAPGAGRGPGNGTGLWGPEGHPCIHAVPMGGRPVRCPWGVLLAQKQTLPGKRLAPVG